MTMAMGGIRPRPSHRQDRLGWQMPASSPILLEVIAHIPTDFFHCSHCERLFDVAGIGESMHQDIRASYPPEMLEEAERLAVWLQDLSLRYGKRLQIRVVDAQSMEGFFKSLRYWTRRYPAFIVDRRKKVIGWDRDALEHLLEARIAQRVSA